MQQKCRIEAEKKAEISSPPPTEPVTEPEEPEPEPPAEEQPEANDENDTAEPDSLAEDVKPESPKISVPVSPAETPKRASISTNESRSRLNSQGHLDLKFYHSSLW
ncbi:hypothetical protein RUM44_009370 [Polyplax serrata]|uniref:Uncharacterized protein n=1 Tax=Polyplax serrata TaxID=468196 RepID=A0ABR1ASI0_POLSC